MQISLRLSRWWYGLFAVGVLAALLAAAALRERSPGEAEEGRGKSTTGPVLASIVGAAVPERVAVPAAGPSGFAPQTRVGFTAGDQWEPSIAADRFGHVYILYPQYKGVPGCETCASPTMVLLVSGDRGATWGAPAVIYPDGAPLKQYDAQIVVDPLDGRTVYAAWLQNYKSDIAVAKSTDFGLTWSVVIADRTNAGTDKPILVVRGPHVYVAYNHSQKIWVSYSHDGGATFTSLSLPKTGKLGWALATGGTIDPAGNVYFAWAGYEQNGGAKGPVNLFISKSSDGGGTWSNSLLEIAAAPPDCSAYLCGWAYLGAQAALASDASGALYALWNANAVDKGPARIYFARSTDGGGTWSPRAEVSTAPAGTEHTFPAIVAGAAGDVRIAWMDTRAGTAWNTVYRSAADGGATWSAEVDLSTYVDGYSYIFRDGFSFPFGDYFEMDIDDRGATQAVWGEGLNWDTPGSIWFTRGR